MRDPFERAISVKMLILALPIITLINQLDWLMTRRRFNRTIRADLEQARETALRSLPPETLARINALKETRPAPSRSKIPFLASDKLATSIAITGTIATNTVIAYAAARKPKPGIPLFLFTISLSIPCAELPGNLALASLALRYVPGLLTDAGVTLPYTLYAFHRLYHGHLLTGRALLWSLGIGALLSLPSTLAGLFFGWMLASARKHETAE